LKLAVLVLSFAMALLAVEGSVRVLDLWKVERKALELVESDSLEAGDRESMRWVVHPYRGWTRRPNRDLTYGGSGSQQTRCPVNVHGFVSCIPDYREIPVEDLAIGIFGGSVAMNLALVAGDTLAEAVAARLPHLAGSVRVLSFAEGGYKQPQQLATLMEALVIGVPLDVVVNLDGFNEVTLGVSDALGRGDHPVYPHRAHLAMALDFAQGIPSNEQVVLAARVLQLRESIGAIRRSAAEKSWLSRWALAQAVVGRWVLTLEARKVEAEMELGELSADAGSSSIIDLPDSCLEPKTLCLKEISQIWVASSLAMSGIAERFGVAYIHVLQPNQYVEGTKRLTDEERAQAFEPEGPWGPPVALGYPLLERRARRLRRRGVDFHNLTMVFADRDDTIYIDRCCHVNATGNTLLAEAIGELVAGAMDVPAHH
jgi:hypothetical protein